MTSRSPRPKQPASQFFVPPDPSRLAEVAMEHKRLFDYLDDWQGRKSQQIAELERQVVDLRAHVQAYELNRKDDRLWLERELAEIRQEIAVAAAKFKSAFATLSIVWTVMLALAGLLIRFL